MRKKLVAGNLKMHKNLTESQALITEIRGIVRDEFRQNDAEIVICPTALALASSARLVEGSEIRIGAQNVNEHKEGAYTGEWSASMLKSAGVTHVIVGHSERRQYYNETNEACALKNKAAIAEELVVLYCVGESLDQRESNSHFDVIKTQVENVLEGITSEEMSHVVIAYEPVWAIGTGKTASAAQAQEVHAFIRGLIDSKYGQTVAQSVRILYGGSVKPDNAKVIFCQEDIDGGLIGGASLKPRDFFDIIKAAQ